MAIADKLTYLDGTKTLIADALASKGQDVSASTFREYATAIGNITATSGEEPTAGTVNLVDSTDPFGDGSLIAKYKLDGDATDACGNYDGTATNVTYDEGKFEQCGVFDGSSSRIQINNPVPTDTSFTLSVWAKFPNGLTTTNVFLGRGLVSTGGIEYGFAFLLKSTGTLDFKRCVGTSTYYTTDTSVISIDTTKYYHFLATYNSTTGEVFLYVDSILIAQGTQSTSPIRYYGTYDDGQFAIGRYNRRGLSEVYADCSIDQLEIYNRALTSDEVYQLYTQGQTLPTPTTDGLIAYYPLTGTAEDKAGTYDGTENSVDYVVDAERGSVASFNGSSSYISAPYNTVALDGNNPFTICFFARTNSISETQVFFTLSNNGLGGSVSIEASILQSNKITFRVYGDATGLAMPTSDTNWHFYSIVNTTSGINIYQDDILVEVYTSAVPNIGTGAYTKLLRLGNAADLNQSNGFNGSIANFRLYNRTLTAEEIATIYNYEKANKPIAVSDGLVAYYPLKENSMDNWANEYDGTAYNVTYGGTSADFNGSSSYVQTPLTPTTKGTFSVWVKRDTNTNNINPISVDAGGYFVVTYGDNIGISANELGFSCFNANANWLTHTDATTNEWHHVTCVYGDRYELWFDGTLVAESTARDIGNTSYQIQIGKWGGSNTYYFDGSISNVRIYNRALTEEEITDIYNSEKGDFGL